MVEAPALGAWDWGPLLDLEWADPAGQGKDSARDVEAGQAAQVAQVGWKLSPKALHLKFDRLNPISGLKKIFALRSLVELLKGLLKALLLLYVLYRAFKNDLSALVDTIHHALPLGAAQMGNAVWHLALKMALMLLVMAFFDYAYQRWEFERSLRMSKKEIKDEFYLGTITAIKPIAFCTTTGGNN